MARTTRPLTNTEVQKAKTVDKDLALHDGDGLFLLVKTIGKKIWRFRYQLPNRSKHTCVTQLPVNIYLSMNNKRLYEEHS
ncbi:integrase [Yersinia enterocolitica]|nr:integrase [Yersinia enterocolitica]